MLPLISLVVLGQGAAQGPSAVDIVQKMVNVYAASQQASGTIELDQTAENVTAKVITKFAFIRPENKLYIEQVRQNSDPKRYLTVSDGRIFSYDKPENILGHDRFNEYVSQHGVTQSIKDIYAAARVGLADHPVALDLAIARTDDIRTVLGQWATMKVHSREAINGVATTAIVGDYKTFPTEPVSGSYEAYITDDSKLIRYVVKQNIGIPAQATGGANGQVVQVVSIWNSTITFGGPVDEKTFKIG